MAPYIGVRGEPPAINYDRSNVAAPFYVMAQSFVRFIVKRASIEFALWSPRYVLSVVLDGWESVTVEGIFQDVPEVTRPHD